MLAKVQAAVPFALRQRVPSRLVPLIAISTLLALCFLFFGSPDSLSWGPEPSQQHHQQLVPTRPSVPPVVQQPEQPQPTDGNHFSHQAPVDDIPKQIWYKLGPAGLTDKTRKWTDGCVRANPDHVVHFMSDPNADDYVKSRFRATHPELVDMFLKLKGWS